jgi:DNA helicase HerA-like ATPase
MVEPIEFATAQTAEGAKPVFLNPALANRHGCISGATGTGKTVTLQKLAEEFSKIGVPVFMADVKGDLSGIAKAAEETEKLRERFAKRKLKPPVFEGCPVVFWDVFGEQGHPVRATISDMGPLLLSRLLQLNDTQEGVLNAVFSIADDKGWLLLDLKDLRSMLSYVGQNAASFRAQYGNISPASIGAIQRGLLALESQGADKFFGEPMLNVDDLIQTVDGKGVINILAADKLILAPKLYATFLLWILSELYENLPEVGDREKPKFVFFFDEAHLLFNEASPVLTQKVEQVVRLIRSKGVGVYFVSQNPMDIPEKVLGQLGNRVQHALRAFTPRDQKAVRTIAETMRPNKNLDIAAAITELGVGEALVSMLSENGTPEITERCYIGCPGSQIGPITPEERKALMRTSIVAGVYDQAVDRESAYEILQAGGGAAPAGKTGASAQGGAASPQESGEPSAMDSVVSGIKDILFGSTGPRGGHRQGVIESMARSAVRQAGTKIIRGVLGSILGGKR